MPFKILYAAGAVGLCFSVLPFAISAQTQAETAQESATFVPIVSECVDMPNATNCGPVRAVVTECAADFEDVQCDVLFEDSDKVFNDPQLKELAQAQLSQASEAIALMTFEEAHNGEIGDIVEENRADAERTMLRGDENLNSHSAPPLLVETD